MPARFARRTTPSTWPPVFYHNSVYLRGVCLGNSHILSSKTLGSANEDTADPPLIVEPVSQPVAGGRARWYRPSSASRGIPHGQRNRRHPRPSEVQGPAGRVGGAAQADR